MSRATTRQCRTAVLPAFALIAAASLSQPLAANDELTVQQITQSSSVSAAPETGTRGNFASIRQSGGDNATVTQERAAGSAVGNRAIVRQDAVPTPAEALESLALSRPGPRFEIRSVSADGSLRETEEETPLGTLIAEFSPAAGFGKDNTAIVTQRNGSNNRALAVQAGQNNRLETIQNGSNNIGIHLQRGSGNNTLLRQTGDGNVNALIARDGVSSTTPGGNTVELNVNSQNGPVKGFAVSAQGPQNYSTINVSKKKQGGGLKIDVR